MRSWVVVLLMTCLAFAGCFGDGDDGKDSTGNEGTPGSGSGSGSGSGPGGVDPCASEEVDEGSTGNSTAGNQTGNGSTSPANGTSGNMSFIHLRQAGNETGNQTGNGTGNATSGGNGTASGNTTKPPRVDANGCEIPNGIPVPVLGLDILSASAPVDITFSFNASDSDGDNLTWTLDVDSDGTIESEGTQNNLPGTYTHTFDTEGDYEAVFIVDDGYDVASFSVTVNILEAIPDVTPFIFEAYFAEPCVQCSESAPSGIGWRSGIQGIDHVWAEIPLEYEGAPFFAKTTGTNVGLSFRESCPAGANVETPASAEATLEGIVPAGAGCILMWEQGTTRGGKLSFIADGDNGDFPEDPLCYTNDFNQIGLSGEGVAVYQTDLGWFYQESNGVPGLQWTEEPDIALGAAGHKPGCKGGDTAII